MGIFDGVQRWQRRRRAKAMLEAGDVAGARSVIGADAGLRHELAEALLESGRLDLSQALLGHQGSTFDALLAATPADPELDRLLAEASARTLPADARTLELSRMLLDRGQQEPALALLERAALSTRAPVMLRAAIEACCEAQAWKRAWPLVEAGLGALKTQRGTPDHAFLLEKHALALGHLEGAAAVQVDLMMRGEIDPFADGGHLVLARALMRSNPVPAVRLTLVSAPQELREGEERLRVERKDAAGLMQVGSAKLRLGELDAAIDAFERGRDVAPRHFALVAGLGAARQLQRAGALARIRSLPDLSAMEGLSALVPDLEQLTMLELRVVQASVKPLLRWLPELTRPLRILPLDVRVTDLPDFEQRRLRVGPRDWDALGGLAGDGLGCVRVETLFDTAAWPLAHELAHLVHGVVPSPPEAEFFATAYVRWLCRRYGLPLSGPEVDTQCIDAIARDA